MTLRAANRTSYPVRTRGFTLVELMIVIGILGVLMALAGPQYRTYQKRSKFTEVVMAAVPFRTAADIAMQTGRASSIEDLDAGANGIPPAIAAGDAVGSRVSSVAMTDGVITATGTPQVDSAVYQIRATLAAPGLVWSIERDVANSCFKNGLC